MDKITTFIGWALLAFFCMQAFRLFSHEQQFLFFIIGGPVAVFIYYQNQKIKELENTICKIDQDLSSKWV